MEYKELAEIYQSLEDTSKRLEKTYLISELLKKTPSEDLKKIVLLLKGRVFPQWHQKKLGVASRLVLKAINIATGTSTNRIEQDWKKTGDLGLTAKKLIKNKTQSTLFFKPLSVNKVFKNIKALPKAKGHGAVDRKIKLIAELLSSAKPIEAKYITRTVLEDLRVGVGEGSLRDAIVWSFFGDKLKIRYNKEENDFDISDEERIEYNKYINAVQEAYDMKNDFAEVAKIAKENGLEGLKNVNLEVGKPIKVMLYQKAEDFEDAFETVGKPAALEYKYDGFRLQIHKNKDDIQLFTRRLDNVTKQFPDVVKVIKNNINSKNFILDAEIIGIDPKTKRWLPFQNISQRIKRKYNIHRMAKTIPVIINIFDAMQINNKNLIKTPFSERRAELKKITDQIPEKIELAEQIITDSQKNAEDFYKQSLGKGNEGIMVKALDKPYKPGSRVGYGVKVKPIMETLDLVITGAEWGQGKRAEWLSSFTVSCIDQDGNFREIGKVGTGIKEKEAEQNKDKNLEGATFKQLTNLLKPLIISEKGKCVKVKPKIVIEINYEEIQRSPTYSSGYALRFPRLVKLRPEKPIEEVSTLEQIREYYQTQKHRK
ncbi:ATP-dependent DNA ligase [Candidatus Woesearchaeota archaeon]|nr:ATP-dependent DNA ligase [Candidatus Woesearchaeota archaeon]